MNSAVIVDPGPAPLPRKLDGCFFGIELSQRRESALDDSGPVVTSRYNHLRPESTVCQRHRIAVQQVLSTVMGQLEAAIRRHDRPLHVFRGILA